MQCQLWACTSNRARRMCLHARKQADRIQPGLVQGAGCHVCLCSIKGAGLCTSLPASRCNQG